MFGESQRDSWALLVSDAIDADTLSGLARRWGVAEETLRGWRDSGASPNIHRLLRIHFSDAELLRLTRLVSRGQLRIEPSQASEPHAHPVPSDVMAQTNALIGAATHVQQEWIESMRDGVVTTNEQQRIEQATDQVIARTRCTRPSFFARLRGLFASPASTRGTR
jgi:hypothetical protein